MWDVSLTKLCIFVAGNPTLEYVGCFIDKSVHAMDGLWFDSKQMTADLCVSVCKAKVTNKIFFIVCLLVWSNDA